MRGWSVHAVGGALDEEWERGGDVGGLEDDGVELDAIAHGNHDLSAHGSRGRGDGRAEPVRW